MLAKLASGVTAAKRLRTTVQREKSQTMEYCRVWRLAKLFIASKTASNARAHDDPPMERRARRESAGRAARSKADKRNSPNSLCTDYTSENFVFS
ncbi:hypothetical protein EVAR_55384_1 [Eumeta japonica]|uniref:Uncharacterized protein n=1 Tax=Eumeta variegata TaxID=151549 RepID=A0A4C1YRD6_EUMVA|nr:hypothetical protein EVAR_55384_1 [Eumeta japonica]